MVTRCSLSLAHSLLHVYASSPVPPPPPPPPPPPLHGSLLRLILLHPSHPASPSALFFLPCFKAKQNRDAAFSIPRRLSLFIYHRFLQTLDYPDTFLRPVFIYRASLPRSPFLRLAHFPRPAIPRQNTKRATTF
jgi:hypothetical protein